MSQLTPTELEQLFDDKNVYYQKAWARFQRRRKMPQWNWAAFFFTNLWMFYRGAKDWAWKLSFAVYILPVCIMMIILNVPFSDFRVLLVNLAFSNLMRIPIALYGNHCYFDHLEKAVAPEMTAEKRTGKIKRLKGGHWVAMLGNSVLFVGALFVSLFLAMFIVRLLGGV